MRKEKIKSTIETSVDMHGLSREIIQREIESVIADAKLNGNKLPFSSYRLLDDAKDNEIGIVIDIADKLDLNPTKELIGKVHKRLRQLAELKWDLIVLGVIKKEE